ncbi:MAG: DUF4202 domain-containing protein [Betaproteobacteria bacterium]|nr:DUF4202 domain-containing protein [Betaproteobacteria bacterium]
MIADPKRFDATVAAFDAANAEDPNRDEGQPKELLYARRMSAMLARFAPDASEAVRLAVRAQHIQRWRTPRSSYPMDRQGYLQWRTGLYRFHAETAGRIMAEHGYDAGTIERVKAAVGKKGLKVNAETQLLEDVTDLVFLEHYIAGFAAQHPEYDEAKWLDIIRKTWQKMSKEARDFVLAGKVSLPETAKPLILKAVS